MRTEPPEIDLAFDLPHGIDKVWRALTTPDLLARWLAPNDMVPELGARFTVRPDDGPPVRCEVVEIDAKRRRLKLAWAVDEETATTVRFELVATAGGTVLRVHHSPCGVAAVAAAAVQPPRLRLVGPAPTVRAAPGRTGLRWAA